MVSYVKQFLTDETGAVTVDWVVLTAGLTTFGFVIGMVIYDAAQHPSEAIGAKLSSMEVGID